MNANEIHSQVLLGSHSQVKAALEPLRLQVEAITGLPARYNGCGKIEVVISDSKAGTTTKGNWAQIWKLAKAVRAALPEADFKVSKPHRAWTDGGTFAIAYDSFTVSPR